MIDRRIKFRHIQCFVTICREGSFKRAAETLYFTQPAISKTLKELEDILGYRLLERDRGGIELTKEGEVLLRFGKASLAALQQGITGVEQEQAVQSPTLSVGVLPSVAARLIPDVAQRLNVLMPGAVLRLADGPHGYLIERLRLGELDIVLGRMGAYSQMMGVTFTQLYQERISLVVRSGHPLLDAPALSRIVDWPVVYPTSASAIRPLADQYFLEQGIGDIPRRIETVSGAFGRVYVQNSDAVWVISEGVVANEVRSGVLAKLPFNTDTTLGAIGIMAREEWEVPVIAKRFKSALQQAIGAMPDLMS